MSNTFNHGVFDLKVTETCRLLEESIDLLKAVNRDRKDLNTELKNSKTQLEMLESKISVERLVMHDDALYFREDALKDFAGFILGRMMNQGCPKPYISTGEKYADELYETFKKHGVRQIDMSKSVDRQIADVRECPPITDFTYAGNITIPTENRQVLLYKEAIEKLRSPEFRAVAEKMNFEEIKYEEGGVIKTISREEMLSDLVPFTASPSVEEQEVGLVPEHIQNKRMEAVNYLYKLGAIYHPRRGWELNTPAILGITAKVIDTKNKINQRMRHELSVKNKLIEKMHFLVERINALQDDLDNAHQFINQMEDLKKEENPIHVLSGDEAVQWDRKYKTGMRVVSTQAIDNDTHTYSVPQGTKGVVTEESNPSADVYEVLFEGFGRHYVYSVSIELDLSPFEENATMNFGGPGVMIEKAVLPQSIDHFEEKLVRQIAETLEVPYDFLETGFIAEPSYEEISKTIAEVQASADDLEHQQMLEREQVLLSFVASLNNTTGAPADMEALRYQQMLDREKAVADSVAHLFADVRTEKELQTTTEHHVEEALKDADLTNVIRFTRKPTEATELPDRKFTLLDRVRAKRPIGKATEMYTKGTIIGMAMPTAHEITEPYLVQFDNGVTVTAREEDLEPA